MPVRFSLSSDCGKSETLRTLLHVYHQIYWEGTHGVSLILLKGEEVLKLLPQGHRPRLLLLLPGLSHWFLCGH